MSRRMKLVLAGVLAATVVLAVLFTAGSSLLVKKYQVKELVVPFPGKTGVLGVLRKSDWLPVEVDEDAVTFKIVSLEPVIRRKIYVTHELISIRYQPSIGGIEKKGEKPKLPLISGKWELMKLIGLMTQVFAREGFKLGEKTAFTEVAGVDAYRFELIKEETPVQYTQYIILWKEGWYVIVYSNFDDDKPGPHFTDFEELLKELKFTSV